ncbi:MAG: TetR/AcrR family transcriptional regulator [Pseudomonadota bacterium]
MSSKNSETREKILIAAWRLLEEDHASGVRMADIAKEAGVSRQAVYLHYPTRGALLVATARYLDVINKVDDRLVKSRAASSGLERLDAYIDALAGYFPKIYGVARAFIAMKDTDEEAAAAWADRMHAIRHGCAAAVSALKKDGDLKPGLTAAQATDTLWMLLSVPNWELLTKECGWSQKRFETTIKSLAFQALTGKEP